MQRCCIRPPLSVVRLGSFEDPLALLAFEFTGPDGDDLASHLNGGIASFSEVLPPLRGLLLAEVRCQDDEPVAVWQVEERDPQAPIGVTAGRLEHQAAQAWRYVLGPPRCPQKEPGVGSDEHPVTGLANRNQTSVHPSQQCHPAMVIQEDLQA